MLTISFARGRIRSARTSGVGDYRQLFGTQYAMRVWLDPAKLNQLRTHRH